MEVGDWGEQCNKHQEGRDLGRKARFGDSEVIMTFATAIENHLPFSMETHPGPGQSNCRN